jgi:hypothetical protein
MEKQGKLEEFNKRQKKQAEKEMERKKKHAENI